MLEPVLQLHLPRRWKPAILGVAFQRTALLGGGQVFVMAKPGTGVTRLIPWMEFGRVIQPGLRISDLRIAELWTTGLPIPGRRIPGRRTPLLRRGLMLILRRPVGLRQKRSKQHQHCCHMTGDLSPPQHSVSQSAFRNFLYVRHLASACLAVMTGSCAYGFSVASSSCTCRSSSMSKSAYKSSFFSSACRSPTAVPG
jgi:hypothetical protein